MNMKRKGAAVLLAVLMVLCALPTTAFARERDGGAGEYLGDDIYAYSYQGWFGSGLDSLLIGCFRTAIPEDAAVTTPGGEVIARREITYVDGMHLMNAVSANDSGARTHALMRLTHLWRDAEGHPVYCYDYATDDNGARALCSFDDLPASYVNRDRFVRAYRMASALSADGFALLRANLRSACRDVTSVVDPSWVMSGEVTYQALVNNTDALQAIVQECVWLVMHDASAGEIQIGTSFGGGGQWIHTKDGDIWIETALQSETAENGTFIDFARLIGIGTGAGEPYGTPELVSSGTVPGDIANPGAAGGQLLVAVKVREYTGFVRVVKSSANTDVTGTDAALYSLAGAVYGVYADSACTELLGRLTTGADGTTEALEVGLGANESMTVYVKEIHAPANYLPDTAVYPVTVSGTAHAAAESAAAAFVEDVPVTCPIGLLVTKIDAETGESVPQGMASLAGAQFTVSYYDSLSEGGSASGGPDSDAPLRTWIFETGADGIIRMDAAHLVSGDELYTAGGRIVLPVGTVTIRETRAPEGYLVNDTVHTLHITAGADGTAVPDVPYTRQEGRTDLQIGHEEQIIRADLRFTKLDIDGRPMAGIPFRIDLLDDDGNVLESCRAVTDDKGRFDTSSGDAGVWFGGSRPERPARGEPGSGALICGRYRVTELRCGANEGNDLLMQELIVTEEGKVYELASGFIDLVIHPESDLVDDTSGSRTATLAEKVFVTDTFRYDHLKTTKTYILETEIIWVSRDGSERQTLGSGRVTFRPEAQDATQTAGGNVRNTVAVRTAGLNGGTICAVDRLYQADDGGETLLVTHNEDLSEERQMLQVPWIGTTAADSAAGGHMGVLSEEASVTDVVEYSGLADGGMYLLEGTLRDAETGEPVTGADGAPCVVTKILRINARLSEMSDRGETVVGPCSGEAEMPAFAFDAAAYAGRTLVVTEVLSDYDTGAVILEHYDLSDEEQSVHFPAIATSAAAEDTQDHVTGNRAETVITDVVSYENLLTDGRTYTIRGYLADRETGSALLIDGARVEAETVFTPEEASGSVVLTFAFDASALPGTTLVAFEELLYDGVTVAVHADVDDAAQSVCIPTIRTQARDARTGIGHARADGETELIDNVRYSNLLPDREYRLRGYLVDRETGEPILADGAAYAGGTADDGAGERVGSELTFTPVSTEGSVDMRFAFDAAALAGRAVVVFEELYLGDVLVASHADIDDENQSGYIPVIRTNAVFAETGEHIAEAAGRVTVVDTVTYEGLRPNTKYVLTGVLTDRETGEPVIADGGPVTAGVTFVTGNAGGGASQGRVPRNDAVGHSARTVSGTIDLGFAFDAEALAGTTVVACETLTLDGREVAVHADLADEAQTVYLPGISTQAADRRSGTQEMTLGTRAALVDEIAYESLMPGRMYTVRGTVMDRETGEAVPDADGEPVTAEATFTPEAPDGTAEVEFRVDTTELHGRELVVFERLYMAADGGAGSGGAGDEIPVARHEDLNAAPQTVRVPERPPAVLTGDSARPAVLMAVCVGAGVVGACGFLGVFRKKRM